MSRVVVLISGRGSNLKALVEKQNCYQVVGVISDKREAAGLEFAKTKQIPTVTVCRENFSNKQEFFQEISAALSSFSPSIVALAGFMRILPATFIESFKNKIINIHPSLLPEFTGLNTHQRALEAKVESHGCTVHFVDSGLDTGPVIAQAVVPVFPSDTVETLSARVLVREHELYPWVISMISSGDIGIYDQTVVLSLKAREEAKERNFI